MAQSRPGQCGAKWLGDSKAKAGEGDTAGQAEPPLCSGGSGSTRDRKLFQERPPVFF